ncbi:DUF1772 domain-containing protein [Bdellovibrio sp. SKB1291214]|uniref:DUF1772 domain-containing protein n=1 Tax=Bdellovibrio sp. SKB1291214 TaxID=1732569 RepID=UPI000B515A22|nr:DUF1772 domain-containing protein [Bdellovibrio sp. SKB1291214]UYL08723.1 DUF1772 domain-containing protein [Bdellovibrio sp. SKB1291214]
MIAIVFRKFIMYLAVLSTGLFAGFTMFFSLTVGPAMKELSPISFLEIFRYDRDAFDQNVLFLYIVMGVSTGIWLLCWIRRCRMVDFYFVLGAFLCVLQEIFLSYFGHYRINTLLRSFAETRTLGGEIYGLREEWVYFMNFHFATNLLGFCLILAALRRAGSGRDTPRNNFLASTHKKENP